MFPNNQQLYTDSRFIVHQVSNSKLLHINLTLHPQVTKHESKTLHFSDVTVPLTLRRACECGLASQMLQFRPQSHSLRSQTLFCFNLRIMICAECCILLRPNSLACQSVTAVSTTWISSLSVLGETRIVFGIRSVSLTSSPAHMDQRTSFVKLT